MQAFQISASFSVLQYDSAEACNNSKICLEKNLMYCLQKIQDL